MPDKTFDLGDYVEVKDRIRIFYELYPAGRLCTEEVTITTALPKPFVMVKALAYRTPDDPHPGVGHSWMEVPGTTPYTRGSEVENAETSAWGRAIGSLGILIDASIASVQEIESKRDDGLIIGPTVTMERRVIEPFEVTVEGKVAYGRTAPSDGNFRQTPNGLVYGFVVEAEGQKRLQVIATDLAEALEIAKPPEKGTWVKVSGIVARIPWQKDGKAMPPYQRMTLSRIETPDYTLPAPTVA